METLLGVTNLTRKADYMFRFDLQDGLYARGINPTDRDYFTVNVCGQLYRLAGLPMGWSLSPFYICKMTLTFVNFQRNPDPEQPIAPESNRSKTYLERAGAAPGFSPTSTTFYCLHQQRRKHSPYATASPTSPRSGRSPRPPHQRFLETSASRTSLGCRHQHNVKILLHAGQKTNQDCATCQTPHRESYAEDAHATRKGPPITRMPCTLPFSWQFRRPYSSSENFTPSSARSGEASSG
jgi:hypothetical protein